MSEQEPKGIDKDVINVLGQTAEGALLDEGGDPIAQQEEKNKFQEKLHEGEIRTLTHWLFKLTIRIFFAVGVAMVFVRVMQLLLPEAWTWLNDEQIQSLDKFLASSFIGGLVGRSLNKVLPNS